MRPGATLSTALASTARAGPGPTCSAARARAALTRLAASIAVGARRPTHVMSRVVMARRTEADVVARSALRPRRPSRSPMALSILRAVELAPAARSRLAYGELGAPPLGDLSLGTRQRCTDERSMDRALILD